MAVAAHLLRRDAVYYWRRKIPRELVDCQNRKHFLLSLRTWRPDHARSLGRQLDAFLDDLTHMPDARFLTQTHTRRHVARRAHEAFGQARTDRRRGQAVERLRPRTGRAGRQANRMGLPAPRCTGPPCERLRCRSGGDPRRWIRHERAGVDNRPSRAASGRRAPLPPSRISCTLCWRRRTPTNPPP